MPENVVSPVVDGVARDRWAASRTSHTTGRAPTVSAIKLVGLAYWGLTPHQQSGSYRGGDYDYDDDEMSVSLVEETRVAGGNHRSGQPSLFSLLELSHLELSHLDLRGTQAGLTEKTVVNRQMELP